MFIRIPIHCKAFHNNVSVSASIIRITTTIFVYCGFMILFSKYYDKRNVLNMKNNCYCFSSAKHLCHKYHMKITTVRTRIMVATKQWMMKAVFTL